LVGGEYVAQAKPPKPFFQLALPARRFSIRILQFGLLELDAQVKLFK
jgi:hypothetical protein